MALFRQNEIDQGARIGRLEKYVYDFHGTPMPSTTLTSLPVNTSVGSGGGGKPPIYSIAPHSVPGDTAITANGDIPFNNPQFFFQGLRILGDDPGILFQDHLHAQVISGVGQKKNGRWEIGKLNSNEDTLSLHNNTHGDIGGRIDLDQYGEVKVSDTILIEDRKVGGGKGTLSLNAAGICNVGVMFGRDGKPIWDMYKTGKDKLEIGYTHEGKYEPAVVIDKDLKVEFTEIPFCLKEPVAENDLVTLKFFNDNIGGSSIGGTSTIVDLGKPVKIKDDLEIYGAGDGSIKFTTNNKQVIEGENGKSWWSVGKASPNENSLNIQNNANGIETGIRLKDNGIIETTGRVSVGSGKGDALLELHSNLKTDILGVDLRDASGSMASLKVEASDLNISSNGDIVLKLKPGKNLFLYNGYQTDKIQTTISGPSGTRPVNNILIGQQYFDTTIKKPIWVQSINPTVWINAMGTIV